MANITERVLDAADDVARLYHSLVVVAGPASTGNTKVLRTVQERTGAPLVNVALELSRRMLDIPLRLRPLRPTPILDEIVEEASPAGGLLVLDRTEFLFDVSLCLNPLELLLKMSRNRTVIAAWTGTVDGGSLTYAAPGHPEHRRDRVQGFLVVTVPS